MPIDRRRFVSGTGYAAVTGMALSPAMLAADSSRPQDLGTPSDPAKPLSWAAVRAQFNLDPDLVHMAGLLLSSHPAGVRRAIDRHRQGLDRNPVEYFGANWATSERACYQAAATYLETEPQNIALTDSTTMGLGLLYNGLRLEPGQEILTTEHDHYSTHTALALKAESSGATLRRIALYEDGHAASAEDIVSRIRDQISHNTRVLALTWVHSCTGVKLPLKAIGDLVADINAQRSDADQIIYCVDGVHGFGIEDLAVEELGCDFFVAGCHKWLFGPRGTGLVWGRAASWSAVRPLIPSFNVNFDESVGALMTPGGFHSFDMRWALPEAFALHEQIGKANVQRRIHGLNDRLKAGLAAIPGLRLHTPMSSTLSSGIVCFEIEGMEPKLVVQQLRECKIVCGTTPYAVSYARLTPGLLNDEADVDLVIASVAAVAARRP